MQTKPGKGAASGGSQATGKLAATKRCCKKISALSLVKVSLGGTFYNNSTVYTAVSATVCSFFLIVLLLEITVSKLSQIGDLEKVTASSTSTWEFEYQENSAVLQALQGANRTHPVLTPTFHDAYAQGYYNTLLTNLFDLRIEITQTLCTLKKGTRPVPVLSILKDTPKALNVTMIKIPGNWFGEFDYQISFEDQKRIYDAFNQCNNSTFVCTY